MTTLALDTTSPDLRPPALRWPRELALHGLVLAVVVATQIIFTPAHDPSADATWHYRLALDLLHGRPIYWFGVDANRFFPDLLFTLLGLVITGGGRFTTWLYAFYAIQFVATYLALYALASAVTRDARERLSLCVLGIAGLLLLTTLSSYWCGWFLEPGGHGTGLSACLAVVALALGLNRAPRLNVAGALLLVGAGALLIASNRYLLVGLFLPLLIAFGAAALRRRLGRGGAGKEGARGPILAVLGCLVAAMVLGALAWRAMEHLSWYRVTGGGSFPPIDPLNPWPWLRQQVVKTVVDLNVTGGEPRQIRYGLVLLFAAGLTASLTALGIVRRGRPGEAAETRLVLALFTAAAALCAVAFVLVMAVETGPYRYRYLTVPLGFGVVYLAARLAGLPLLTRGGQGWIAAVLVALLATALFRLSERQGTAEGNRALDRGVVRLEQALRARSPATPLKGFADYWMAHDVTVRSSLVHLLSMKVDEPRVTPYNNNAAELCGEGFFFVLHDRHRDEPRRSTIVGGLGEPQAVESVSVGRYAEVDILYYDPRTLRERLIEPSRDEARRLFPRFRCP